MSTFSASIGRWPTLDDFPALRSHTDEELKLRGLAPDMVADEVLRFFLTFFVFVVVFLSFSIQSYCHAIRTVTRLCNIGWYDWTGSGESHIRC